METEADHRSRFALERRAVELRAKRNQRRVVDMRKKRHHPVGSRHAMQLGLTLR